MLHHLHTITPYRIRHHYNKPPPEFITPLHKATPIQWNYTPTCFLFNRPELKRVIFDQEPGLLMLFEHCVANEPDIPEPVKRHLNDNTIPYLLLIFITNPFDIEHYVPYTIPGHLKRNPVFVHHINNFMSLFTSHLHESLTTDYISFVNIFTTIQNFYYILFDTVQRKNDFICSTLSLRLGYIPSYLSQIQRRRLLIYSHLDPDTVKEANLYLKKHCHPMMILYETNPVNQFLLPDEWKLLSMYIPSHLSPRAKTCIDNFKKTLYPQDTENTKFEYHAIPVGGGCGWQVPGVDICLVQFLTFLQPNWMELWTAMRWTLCTEMLKRLLWLNENVHLLIIDPIDILSILFSPE
jgi:hypothetical protein